MFASGPETDDMREVSFTGTTSGAGGVVADPAGARGTEEGTDAGFTGGTAGVRDAGGSSDGAAGLKGTTGGGAATTFAAGPETGAKGETGFTGDTAEAGGTGVGPARTAGAEGARGEAGFKGDTARATSAEADPAATSEGVIGPEASTTGWEAGATGLEGSTTGGAIGPGVAVLEAGPAGTEEAVIGPERVATDGESGDRGLEASTAGAAMPDIGTEGPGPANDRGQGAGAIGWEEDIMVVITGQEVDVTEDTLTAIDLDAGTPGTTCGSSEAAEAKGGAPSWTVGTTGLEEAPTRATVPGVLAEGEGRFIGVSGFTEGNTSEAKGQEAGTTGLGVVTARGRLERNVLAEPTGVDAEASERVKGKAGCNFWFWAVASLGTGKDPRSESGALGPRTVAPGTTGAGEGLSRPRAESDVGGGGAGRTGGRDGAVTGTTE